MNEPAPKILTGGHSTPKFVRDIASAFFLVIIFGMGSKYLNKMKTEKGKKKWKSEEKDLPDVFLPVPGSLGPSRGAKTCCNVAHV